MADLFFFESALVKKRNSIEGFLRRCRLNIGGNTARGSTSSTSLARRGSVGVGWVGRVEPEHIGVVLMKIHD